MDLSELIVNKIKIPILHKDWVDKESLLAMGIRLMVRNGCEWVADF